MVLMWQNLAPDVGTWKAPSDRTLALRRYRLAPPRLIWHLRWPPYVLAPYLANGTWHFSTSVPVRHLRTIIHP